MAFRRGPGNGGWSVAVRPSRSPSEAMESSEMTDVHLGGDAQAVLVQERELRFGCSNILALREEHKREPLTGKGLHCMRTIAIEEHHCRLTVHRTAWEHARFLELQ